MGAREGGTSVPRALPGYVTFSLLGEVSIGDVTAVWRLRNLEDRAREALVDRPRDRAARGRGEARPADAAGLEAVQLGRTG